MKILAVCLGNICRSPLAEGLLRREIDRRGLEWEVASGGMADYHIGNPPDPRSIAIAAEHGIDISRQCSYRVTAADFSTYDIIFGMDRQNVIDLQNLAPSKGQGEKIRLFLDFSGLSDEYGPDVFDPYYDDGGFAGVYDILKQAAVAVIDRLEQEIG